MQSFKPFRATTHRQQKYYSEKRTSSQNKDSVFNLPRQIIAQKSVILINPQILKNVPDPEHKIATDYQKHLKKTMKKQSMEIINKKTLQRITSSFVQMDTIPRDSHEKIIRNKSSQISPNKSVAFKTLNILYRTIIQTKARTRKKESFQLNAKRLPILQKGVIQQPLQLTTKKTSQIFARNSSFDKYKLNLTTIQNQSSRRGVEKYSNVQNKTQDSNLYELVEKESQRSYVYTKKRRFGKERSERNINEIVPWNMFEPEQEVDLYE